jgi:hypothetical protein
MIRNIVGGWVAKESVSWQRRKIITSKEKWVAK